MKIVYIIGIVAVLAISLVYAHSIWSGTSRETTSGYGMMGMHDEMEEIMEDGQYSDLEDYRQEVGVNVMPFVNEDNFESMQEMHEQMEQYHEQSGFGMGCHRW